MNAEHLTNLLEKGYILYMKDGEISAKQSPEYGQVILKYKAGKMYQLEYTQTE